MNKKVFVEFLDTKLSFLVDNVKQEEINKYVSVIDNYVNMGQTEEAAISSFGDPEDLVKAIYLSHGLDYKKIFSGKITGKSVKNAFRNFYSQITGPDRKIARSAILSLLYIILIVILLKIIFIFIRDMGSQFFSDMFSSKTFSRVYDVSFEIIYILTAIMFFFKMFGKKFN